MWLILGWELGFELLLFRFGSSFYFVMGNPFKLIKDIVISLAYSLC